MLSLSNRYDERYYSHHFICSSPLLVPTWTPQKLREIWGEMVFMYSFGYRAGEKVNVWKYLIFSSVGSLSSFPCFTIAKENILRPFLWYFFSLRQGNSDRQRGFQLIEKYAAISSASSVTSKLQNPIKRSSSDLSICLEHVWKQKSFFFVREETKKNAFEVLWGRFQLRINLKQIIPLWWEVIGFNLGRPRSEWGKQNGSWRSFCREQKGDPNWKQQFYKCSTWHIF